MKRYKLKYSTNCAIHKGHFFRVGQKVKIDVDLLLKNHRSRNKTENLKYTTYLENNRDTIFEIEWIESYPGAGEVLGVVLKDFMHLLDLNDLILL